MALDTFFHWFKAKILLSPAGTYFLEIVFCYKIYNCRQYEFFSILPRMFTKQHCDDKVKTGNFFQKTSSEKSQVAAQNFMSKCDRTCVLVDKFFLLDHCAFFEDDRAFSWLKNEVFHVYKPNSVSDYQGPPHFRALKLFWNYANSVEIPSEQRWKMRR